MQLGITDQIRLAFQRQHRVSAVAGAFLGSIPPLAAFAFAHWGLGEMSSWRNWVAATFVLACLAFSAPKVYRWSLIAFRSRVEASGFAVLLEGAMTLADHSALVLAIVSYACLATLVLINAVVTACSVALDQKAQRAAARAEEAAPVFQVVRRPVAKITAKKRAT